MSTRRENNLSGNGKPPFAERSAASTKSWWAGQWLRAVATIVDPTRLTQGRQCARQGCVQNLEIKPGLITGYVQGSQANPYYVRIAIRPYDQAEWKRVLALLARRALYAARLLNGEMPMDIESVLAQGRLSLFPEPGELTAECTCTDWSPMCKHAAALCHELSEQLDENPFLLFLMRGRPQHQVLSELRRLRSRPESPSLQTPPPSSDSSALPTDPRLFWARDPALREIRIRIAPPKIPLALLRQLGPPPLPDAEQIVMQLSKVYRLVTEKALRLAYGDEESDES